MKDIPNIHSPANELAKAFRASADDIGNTSNYISNKTAKKQKAKFKKMKAI